MGGHTHPRAIEFTLLSLHPQSVHESIHIFLLQCTGDYCLKMGKRSESNSPVIWTGELQKQSYKAYDNIIQQVDNNCSTLKNQCDDLLDKIYESEQNIQEFKNSLAMYEKDLQSQLEQQKLLRKLKFQIEKYIPVIPLDDQVCDSPEKERRKDYRIVGDSDTNSATTPSREHDLNAVDTEKINEDDDSVEENEDSPAPTAYNCSLCGFTAKNRIGLSTHTRYCRVGTSDKIVGKRRKPTYICPDCPGKTFKNGISLKNHMRDHLY